MGPCGAAVCWFAVSIWCRAGAGGCGVACVAGAVQQHAGEGGSARVKAGRRRRRTHLEHDDVAFVSSKSLLGLLKLVRPPGTKEYMFRPLSSSVPVLQGRWPATRAVLCML